MAMPPVDGVASLDSRQPSAAAAMAPVCNSPETRPASSVHSGAHTPRTASIASQMQDDDAERSAGAASKSRRSQEDDAKRSAAAMGAVSAAPGDHAQALEKGAPRSDNSIDEKTAFEVEEEFTFPEGGFRAWLIIFGTWVCIFFTWGSINTFGAFQEYYASTILADKSPDQIAWIGSFQYLLIFGCGLPLGRAFDLGMMKPILIVGVALWVVCTMLLSLCTEYWQIFLAQGVGLGLADGIIFNLAVAVPGHYFKKRRAFAFGLQATGSSIGGTVLPIMISHLIPTVGYPWAMRILGFMGLACLTFSCIVVKTRLPPIASVRNGGWRTVQWFDGSAFRNPAYSIFCAGTTIAFLGIYSCFTYNTVFTQQYNIPAGPYFLSVLNAASTFGRAIPGYYADRVGPFNMIVPCMTVASIMLFVFPLCTNLGGITAFSIIYGAASGTYVSILPACVSHMGSSRTIGTRVGMNFFVISFAGLVGTPIGGALLGKGPEYNWWAVMGFSGAVAAVGTVLIFAARQCITKGKLLTKV